MLILSPCLKIGVILAIFKSGGIIPVSNEELIMSETTPATDSMVFLAINGSIPSGQGEREYFAKFAKLITSWGVVGRRPNEVGSGELIWSYMLFFPFGIFCAREWPIGAAHKVRHARGGRGPRRCDSL